MFLLRSILVATVITLATLYGSFAAMAGRLPSISELAIKIIVQEMQDEIKQHATRKPLPAPAPPQPAPKPYVVSEQDVEFLAIAIYCEAGSNRLPDELRIAVGDVILNRVNDPRFPGCVEHVLTARRQYGLFWKYGIKWPKKASNPIEKEAVERARRIARTLLSGHHGPLYGAGYVWQAQFKQGKEVIKIANMYFGK